MRTVSTNQQDTCIGWCAFGGVQSPTTDEVFVELSMCSDMHNSTDLLKLWQLVASKCHRGGIHPSFWVGWVHNRWSVNGRVGIVHEGLVTNLIFLKLCGPCIWVRVVCAIIVWLPWSTFPAALPPLFLLNHQLTINNSPSSTRHQESINNRLSFSSLFWNFSDSTAPTIDGSLTNVLYQLLPWIWMTFQEFNLLFTIWCLPSLLSTCFLHVCLSACFYNSQSSFQSALQFVVCLSLRFLTDRPKIPTLACSFKQRLISMHQFSFVYIPLIGRDKGGVCACFSS